MMLSADWLRLSNVGVHIRRVGAWQRDATGRTAVRTLRLARFGDNMRNVAVTEGDKVEAELPVASGVAAGLVAVRRVREHLRRQ